MTTCKVFVSSTTRDLAKYREAALDVIGKVNETFGRYFALLPATMDSQTPDGEDDPPVEVSRSWVRDCDWVVLIVAWYYGKVPAQLGLSITEFEYEEALKHGKKCFVFLAGELTDPRSYQYWPLDRTAEGGHSLSDFQRDSEYREQEAALLRFKARIRETRHFKLFTNIEDFRVKLNETLSRKVLATVSERLGPQLVALGLKPKLNDCIADVKVLAQLKRLHDRLHQIRQFGVRRWRESLLAHWPDDQRPPDRALVAYLREIPNISRLIGMISGLAADLPADLRLHLRPIRQVAEHEFPDVEECSKADFAASTDDFASRVQQAFTGCNTLMERRAWRLEQSYRSLIDSAVRVVPDRRHLLWSELERSKPNYERLKLVLENHYAWQRVHDEMETIDDNVDSEAPDGDGRALQRRALALGRIEELVRTRAVSELLRGAEQILENDVDRLTEWPHLIRKVRRHSDALADEMDMVEHYLALRTNFDDLFFQIDRETLHAVESAEGRVKAVEAGLQGTDDSFTETGRDSLTRPGDNTIASTGP